MKAPIFIYGTLCSPQVVEVLLGRSIPAIHMPRARLQGYARCPVRNCVFPGTIPTPDQPNNHVDGFLLENLSSVECELLDYFEGDEYDKRIVQVRRDDNPETTVPAELYVWKSHLIEELERDRQWTYEMFCKNHLDWYLENTVRPCRKEMEQLGMTSEK